MWLCTAEQSSNMFTSCDVSCVCKHNKSLSKKASKILLRVIRWTRLSINLGNKTTLLPALCPLKLRGKTSREHAHRPESVLWDNLLLLVLSGWPALPGVQFSAAAEGLLTAQEIYSRPSLVWAVLQMGRLRKKKNPSGWFLPHAASLSGSSRESGSLCLGLLNAAVISLSLCAPNSQEMCTVEGEHLYTKKRGGRGGSLWKFLICLCKSAPWANVSLCVHAWIRWSL